LNFTAEAHSIDTFGKNFSQTNYIHIPKVYWDLTTEKILTMEFIDGTRLLEVMKSDRDEQFDKKLIASRGVDAMLKQIFIDRFFHGDPHPGNIFILEDNKLAFLDFGIAGRLDEQTVNIMADLLVAVTQNDVNKMMIGWSELDIIDATTNTKSLRSEVKILMDKYYGLPLKELHAGEVMQEMFAVIARHHIKIPVDLTLLGKAMVTIEGVGQELNPDFNMAAQVKPFAQKLIKQKYSPEALFKRSTNLIKELLKILEKIPDEFYWLIKNLRQSELTIGIKHKGLDDVINVINRASNRLSFALIIAALIIGSSLIINFSQGPFIFGYPILGIFGFLIAAVLGLGLIISIIRKGKL
jgi:ubiquinone biosynthesis protein